MGRYTIKSKAFTLIELLVVISIIGILAGVVIASLNSARDRGRIAAIKSNLRNAVSQAHVYYLDNNGSYAGLCNDQKIVSILDSLNVISNANCYIGSATLNSIDFGIGVLYRDINYTADPHGILELDSASSVSSYTFDGALAYCASLSKRVPGVSSMKALFDIHNANYASSVQYWSGTSVSADTAFRIRLDNGSTVLEDKTLIRRVLCGK